jgi:hypothetical protein
LTNKKCLPYYSSEIHLLNEEFNEERNPAGCRGIWIGLDVVRSGGFFGISTLIEF